MYQVVDGAPATRHPTPAGAASTGPPVPTGAATAVVTVHHGLGGGLDRVHCRGTLALQDISIALQSYKFVGFSVHEQNRKNVLGGNSHQAHFHRVRTTCGDILARTDIGIKLNKRFIRIFVLAMCLFLSLK